MKLNKEQLEKINDGLNSIFSFCPEFENDDNLDLIYSNERIDEIIIEEENIEYLEILFPGEMDPTEIGIEDFLDTVEEIKTIKITTPSLIQTKLTRYYIVSAYEQTDQHILSLHLLDSKTDGIKIDLVVDSIIIGMAATKLGQYDKDDWGTISPYIGIVIKYESEKYILEKEKEEELINSYIFEVADSINIAISFSKIRNPIYDFYDATAEIDEDGIQALRDLEPYNEAMKFFISAIQINDPELKFLNFYKVLEHFSPIAVNIEANELMRKKLDAPKNSFENGDYIRSIFELANSMKDRFNDEDLMIASFNTCFDFVGLFTKLPPSLIKKIKKNIQEKELKYSTNKQKIITASNIAGKIIYKTRNKVVHAKSNFTLTGEEINLPEFNELNNFMKEASSQAIRWYSRQPNHLKLEIIK